MWGCVLDQQRNSFHNRLEKPQLVIVLLYTCMVF